MSSKTFKLEVITPERKLFSGDVEGVIAPATEGFLGILYNHAPMVASLKIGVLEYKVNGKYRKMTLCGGYLEVSNNVVSVLADTAELPEEIDVERAEKAKQRAEERIHKHPPGTDVARAELALKKALLRISTAGK